MQQHLQESKKKSSLTSVSNGEATATPGNIVHHSLSVNVSACHPSVFTGKDILACVKTGGIYGGTAFALVTLSQLSIHDSGMVVWFILLALAYVVIGACVIPFYYGRHRADWRQGFLMTAVVVPMGMAGMLWGNAIGNWFLHTKGGVDSQFFVPVESIAAFSGIIGGIIGRRRHKH